MSKRSIGCRTVGAGVAILFCCLAPQASAGVIALDLTATGTLFSCANPGSGCTAGWTFYVNSPILVDALGFWDQDANGLANSHPVGLWTSSGSLLASATVTSASTPVASAVSTGQWLFTSIAPTSLTTGDYVIGAFYSDGSADFAQGVASASTISLITFVNAVDGFGGSLALPTGAYPGYNAGFFGPNLEIATPEPTGAVLLATGFGALILYSRRKRHNQR